MSRKFLFNSCHLSLIPSSDIEEEVRRSVGDRKVFILVMDLSSPLSSSRLLFVTGVGWSGQYCRLCSASTCTGKGSSVWSRRRYR